MRLIRIAAVKNIKVLEQAMIAEILPFDNVVNNILENVLKPAGNNAVFSCDCQHTGIKQ